MEIILLRRAVASCVQPVRGVIAGDMHGPTTLGNRQHTCSGQRIPSTRMLCWLRPPAPHFSTCRLGLQGHVSTEASPVRHHATCSALIQPQPWAHQKPAAHYTAPTLLGPSRCRSPPARKHLQHNAVMTQGASQLPTARARRAQDHTMVTRPQQRCRPAIATWQYSCPAKQQPLKGTEA
jgi:hypothetical protein